MLLIVNSSVSNQPPPPFPRHQHPQMFYPCSFFSIFSSSFLPLSPQSPKPKFVLGLAAQFYPITRHNDQRRFNIAKTKQTRSCIHTQTSINKHTHTNARTHAHIHTHIDIHINTHIHTLAHNTHAKTPIQLKKENILKGGNLRKVQFCKHFVKV